MSAFTPVLTSLMAAETPTLPLTPEPDWALPRRMASATPPASAQMTAPSVARTWTGPVVMTVLPPP
jgi:hypothetical protein